eukprot:2918874-Pleurochrysis_carterae.AAC.2
MDWTLGGAQFYSPTLHAFLNGLYENADKDDVIPLADHVHKRIRYQLAFSEKLLMPNTCVLLRPTRSHYDAWYSGLVDSFQAHHHRDSC